MPLPVAIVGLGPRWVTTYGPALRVLHARLTARVIYTTVAAQAEPFAAEFDARVTDSLTTMFCRDDLRAVLILDTDWQGRMPVEMAARAGRPVFWAGFGPDDFSSLLVLDRDSTEQGAFVMPELPVRYQPSTIRLRELLSSRLGRATSARFEMRSCPNSERPELLSLASAVDWCCHIADTSPHQLLVDVRQCRAELFFRPPLAGRPPFHAVISWEQTSSETQRVLVNGTRGRALLNGARSIAWGIDGSEVSESLDTDRPELELMIDHFARRVVGGLIPVPTLHDLSQAIQLCQCAIETK